MSVENRLPVPQFYYDTAQKEFYVQGRSGKWVPVTTALLKSHLRNAGFSGRIVHTASPIDDEIVRIQTDSCVDFAMPLAGYPAGLVSLNNRRLLVTESPITIEPREGEWPTIAAILQRMLNDAVEDQRPYLYGWLHVAITAFRRGCWQPGQICVFAGPAGSGKSLLQRLVTDLLGGRSQKAFQYISGRTPFNADLFRAEHLMIEDDAESCDMRVRRHIGAVFKSIAVNAEHYFHAKGKTALCLNPFWRMTVSVNDAPERLQVIPPVEEDIQDKLLLLRVAPGAMPMPTTTIEEQRAFWTQLQLELPAFMHFLIEYQIPEALRSARFGVRQYHHPILLDSLNGISDQAQLLELIDCALISGLPTGPIFTGTAAQLERALYDCRGAIEQQAKKLFRFPGACSTFLGRLVQELPSRVQRVRRSHYRILPPHSEEPVVACM